jgi:hypothetical protein
MDKVRIEIKNIFKLKDSQFGFKSFKSCELALNTINDSHLWATSII